MTLVRKSVIDEERAKRVGEAKSLTLPEDTIKELDNLVSSEGEFGKLVGNFCSNFVTALESEGAPPSTVVYIYYLFVLSQLGLVRMFRKELELRELDKTYGR